MRSTRPFYKKPKFFYVVNGVAILALVGVCFSMHSTIVTLETKVKTASNLPTMYVSLSTVPLSRVLIHFDSSTTANSQQHHVATNYLGQTDRLPMSMLPSKFAVDYVTPRQDQASRGTCWDFATIGFLEQSYRDNGVKNGWLEPEEYVAFSEQAYGAEILKLCTGPEDSPQQKDCRVAGDSVRKTLCVVVSL